MKTAHTTQDRTHIRKTTAHKRQERTPTTLNTAHNRQKTAILNKRQHIWAKNMGVSGLGVLQHTALTEL